MAEPLRLETWKLVKEGIARHYRHVATAKERGKLLVACNGLLPLEILAGLDAEELMGEPFAATQAADTRLITQLHEAAEQRGYPKDMCHYAKAFLGSMFLDKGTNGGSFPRPDLCVADCECTTHGNWMRAVSEYYDIPFFAFDHPYCFDGITEPKIQYYVSQCYEFIEWAEKATGRRYDEEKFMECFQRMMRCKQLWSEIEAMQKTVPAPLDLRALVTLYTPAVHCYLDLDDVESIYLSLKDEVQMRVDKGIGANPKEKFRILFYWIPAWYNLRDLRFVDDYGAVFLGSVYICHWGSDWWENPDGSMGRPEWLGQKPKDLDEAFRWLAIRTLGHPWRQEALLKNTLRYIEEYKVDGVVGHIARGCEAFLRGWQWLKMPLEERGIPCVSFEGSMADSRDYTDTEVKERLHTWLEGLGLRRMDTL